MKTNQLRCPMHLASKAESTGYGVQSVLYNGEAIQGKGLFRKVTKHMHTNTQPEIWGRLLIFQDITSLIESLRECEDSDLVFEPISPED